MCFACRTKETPPSDVLLCRNQGSNKRETNAEHKRSLLGTVRNKDSDYLSTCGLPTVCTKWTLYHSGQQGATLTELLCRMLANSYGVPLLWWALSSLHCLITHRPITQLLQFLLTKELQVNSSRWEEFICPHVNLQMPSQPAQPLLYAPSFLSYLFIYLLPCWSKARASQMGAPSSTAGLYHPSILYLTPYFKYFFKALSFKA